MGFIRNALEYAMQNGYIKQSLVNEYITRYAPDKRHKLFWLASDCYKSGCSSGIVKYRNREYYFTVVNDMLIVQYN